MGRRRASTSKLRVREEEEEEELLKMLLIAALTFEEKEAYAEAVSLTLSHDEHTRKIYDSIKKCSQAHELIK